MTNNSKNFIATFLLAIILSLFLPWWSVMTAALATALFIPLKRVAVFLVPFFAIFLFWALYCFILSNANDFILAKRIAVLLPLGGSPYLLIGVSASIGGIAAGIAAIFGKQLRMITNSKD